MKNWSKRKKILMGILVLFLVAQVFQPSKNQGSASGPKDIMTVMQVPDSVMAVLKNSCYDCHSNYTRYPWYDNITPANWFVAHHVDEGKRELNFSIFGEYNPRRQAKKLDEAAEQVEEGKMPLDSYTLLHPGAKLSDAQKQLLINWFKNAKAGTGAGLENSREKMGD